jgi:hypothetical protein
VGVAPITAMNVLRALVVLVLVCGGDALLSGDAPAQEINFDQINKFESLGTGTLFGPTSCGKMNHIQWVCLRPRVSSSTTC